jgi:hypothetical protein
MNSETRILCRICNQPVRLTSDIAVDEDGQAVHENCYVQKLASARPKWNPPADQSRNRYQQPNTNAVETSKPQGTARYTQNRTSG